MARNRTFTEDEFLYPSSDDMPEGETDLHRKIVADLLVRLDARYADASDVYVSGGLKVYWEKWNPYEVVVPDCFVVFGIPKRDRNRYLGWDEGRLPSVVFEVDSREGRPHDLETKFRVYQDAWRVTEYFVFDPAGTGSEPPLRGYRRAGDRLAPIIPRDGMLASKVLGITMTPSAERLILRDDTSGEPVLTLVESEIAKLRAELAAVRQPRPGA